MCLYYFPMESIFGQCYPCEISTPQVLPKLDIMFICRVNIHIILNIYVFYVA